MQRYFEVPVPNIGIRILVQMRRMVELYIKLAELETTKEVLDERLVDYSRRERDAVSWLDMISITDNIGNLNMLLQGAILCSLKDIFPSALKLTICAFLFVNS